MTLEQLRIFVAVAERQHIARAALSLHLSQPAVNAAIAALEKRRGANLFHRAGRGVALSDAGSLLLREARALLARADASTVAEPDPVGLTPGMLPIYASRTIAGTWLPRHLVAFRRAHPAIDLRLSIGDTAQAQAAIREGEAALAFVEGEPDDPNLLAEEVARDTMLVVVGREHPWCKSADVGARDFMDAEWVLRETGSRTRVVFEAAMAALGVPPAELRVAMELPSDEAVRATVEAGLGAAPISAAVAASSLQAGLLHRVPFDLPGRVFYAVRHQGRNANAAADALLAMARGK